MGNLMKNGVSYTGSMLGGSTKTFKGILEAGETSISFVDTLITGNSTIDYETSKLGVNPTNIEVANNAVTLTFAAQAEDIGIRVTISNDAAEPAPTKMRFLKATGQQYIELPDVRGNEGIKLEFYGYLADCTTTAQGLFGTQWSRDCLCIINSLQSAGSVDIEWQRNGGGTDALTVPCNKPVYFVFDTNGGVRANEQTITFTPTWYSGNTLKLFCGGADGAHASKLWASEMKIYKNNVLVKDLIPTKVKGVPCYYDIIGRKAYFSKTSTPFQLEEIEYEPTPCLLSNGNAKLNLTTITGLKQNASNYKVETKLNISLTHKKENSQIYYLGSNYVRGNDDVSIYKNGNTGNFVVKRSGTTIPIIANTWTNISMTSQKFGVGDLEFDNPVGYNDSMGIFQSGGTSSYAAIGPMQIYVNDELKYDFEPRVNANGIGYYYDKISGNSYVSNTSTSFGYACF